MKAMHPAAAKTLLALAFAATCLANAPSGQKVVHQLCYGDQISRLCREDKAIGLMEYFVSKLVDKMSKNDPRREFLETYFMTPQPELNSAEYEKYTSVLDPYVMRMIDESTDYYKVKFKRQEDIDVQQDICCPVGYGCYGSNMMPGVTFCYDPKKNIMLWTEEQDPSWPAGKLNLETLDYTRGSTGYTSNIMFNRKTEDGQGLPDPAPGINGTISPTTISSNYSIAPTASRATLYITTGTTYTKPIVTKLVDPILTQGTGVALAIIPRFNAVLFAFVFVIFMMLLW